MAKRFCKMNRKQIADNLGDIHRLVIEPKYVCRSCARSSAEKSSLCKPAAIPPQTCQEKPAEQQQSCALLAGAIPRVASPAAVKTQSNTQAVRCVVERVKQKVSQAKAEAELNQKTVANNQVIDLSDKQAIKKAKKAIKKHYKQQKKLLKLAKKQQKLMRKQNKLEGKVKLSGLIAEGTEQQVKMNLH